MNAVLFQVDACFRFMSADKLLLEVSRCPNIDLCINNPGVDHPCQEIIANQTCQGLGSFQVPEPWNGDIANSSILFLSSNPSISSDEIYPLMSWEDSELIDFFTFRFSNGKHEWTNNLKKPLLKNGSYGRAVQFWSRVQAKATELLGRESSPGVDYSITEVVRCKSHNEIGVQSAKKECSDRYLLRTLEITGAKVIVVLGKPARLMIREVFSLSNPLVNQVVDLEISGKQKLFAFLPHPNARGMTSFKKCVHLNKIEKLRNAIVSDI